MKPRILKFIAASAIVAASAWTAMSLSANPAEVTNTKVSQAEALAQMERDEAEIGSRLKMSAPMELYLVNGEDPIMEGVKNGMIIDVSLDKVEADLAAAAATSDRQDDMWASEQAHRAAFRFFPSTPARGGRIK